MGRPTKYDSKILKVIEDMFKEGASITEICAKIDISRETFNQWQKTNKEFYDTIKRYLQSSEGWWLAQGRINLQNKQFNAVLWYMNMKNRFGWADKQEITGKDGEALIPIIKFKNFNE